MDLVVAQELGQGESCFLDLVLLQDLVFNIFLKGLACSRRGVNRDLFIAGTVTIRSSDFLNDVHTRPEQSGIHGRVIAGGLKGCDNHIA